MEGHIGTQRGTAAHEDALAADHRIGMRESHLAYVTFATGSRASDSRVGT